MPLAMKHPRTRLKGSPSVLERADKGIAEPSVLGPLFSDSEAYLVNKVHEERMGLHLVIQLVKNNK